MLRARGVNLQENHDNAKTCARFELCPLYKSPPSVARRELSTDLTWLAHRPEPENPPLPSRSRSGRVLGEGGVIRSINPIADIGTS